MKVTKPKLCKGLWVASHIRINLTRNWIIFNVGLLKSFPQVGLIIIILNLTYNIILSWCSVDVIKGFISCPHFRGFVTSTDLGPRFLQDHYPDLWWVTLTLALGPWKAELLLTRRVDVERKPIIYHYFDVFPVYCHHHSVTPSIIDLLGKEVVSEPQTKLLPWKLVFWPHVWWVPCKTSKSG